MISLTRNVRRNLYNKQRSINKFVRTTRQQQRSVAADTRQQKLETWIDIRNWRRDTDVYIQAGIMRLNKRYPSNGIWSSKLYFEEKCRSPAVMRFIMQLQTESPSLNVIVSFLRKAFAVSVCPAIQWWQLVREQRWQWVR